MATAEIICPRDLISDDSITIHMEVIYPSD